MDYKPQRDETPTKYNLLDVVEGRIEALAMHATRSFCWYHVIQSEKPDMCHAYDILRSTQYGGSCRSRNK